MWQTKKFRTREAMLRWIEKNEHRYQWYEIFIHNDYAVEYKPLRFVY